jgi:hypothetical protein
MKLRRRYIVLLFIFCSVKSFSQTGYPKEWFEVLRRNKLGKEFIFDKSKGESADKTWLKYLGIVKTKKGKSYKILSSVWVWGISKRGTTRIVLFDLKNQYIGNYALGMTYEAPAKVEKNSVVFRFPKDSGRNFKLIQRLGFSDGIPKTFFLECKDGMGDIYSFDRQY